MNRCCLVMYLRKLNVFQVTTVVIGEQIFKRNSQVSVVIETGVSLFLEIVDTFQLSCD